MKAVLNGRVIAESDDVKTVEGYAYFPRSSVDFSALTESPTSSRCFWKGKASYYHVLDDDGHQAPDSASYYAQPWPLARGLVSDRIAFWREVVVR